jgi:SET domain-containing protein
MWNHSEDPNTGVGPAGSTDWNSSYAIKDIQPGEELLDDYGTYGYPDWFTKLSEEFGYKPDFFQVKNEFILPGFHIEYEIKESPGKGLGIFTKQFIPKDALIWYCKEGSNVRHYSSEEEVMDHLSALSLEQQHYFMHHIYVDAGKVVEILDDADKWNHSESPNTVSGVNNDWLSTFARRDIEPGEELLDDYGLYDYPDWFLSLLHKYDYIVEEFVTIKTPVNP